MKRIFTVLASAGLLWGMALTGAAQARDGGTESPLGQSAQLVGDCGQVELTFTNDHEDTTYVWNVQTNDDQNENVSVPAADSPVTHTVTLEPGEGVGWVSYGTVAGPESDYYLANKTVEVPLCAPAPDPDPDPTPEPQKPSATVTENCDKGGLEVVIDNPTSRDLSLSVHMNVKGSDDTFKRDVKVPAGESRNGVVPVPEDAEAHLLVVTKGGRNLYNDWHTFDCEPPDEPPGDEPPGDEPPSDEPGEPIATIGDVHCEGETGVNVTLDNSAVDADTTFVVTGKFGDEASEQSVTVEAGGAATAFVPVPPGVPGVITVTVDGETVLDAPGKLVCEGDGSEPPAFDDTTPVANKGGALPFTGSTTGLIVGIALALLAAGGLTLGGLRLFRNRA